MLTGDAPGPPLPAHIHEHCVIPEADISSAIVSVGKGPQENLDRESEIRTWGGADNGGGAELLASQDEPQERMTSIKPAEDSTRGARASKCCTQWLL